MSIMRVAITGHTKGLGKELYNRFDDVTGFSSSNDYDVSDSYERAKIINQIRDCDLFINNAHPFFDQTRMLMEVFDEWKYQDKTIVNIISRAKYDNISKGFMYAASKASLSHLSHNLRFSTDKECRIIDVNPGLLNSDLPSLTYTEMADIVMWCINQPKHIEVGEISVWNKGPFIKVQEEKEKRISKSEQYSLEDKNK